LVEMKGCPTSNWSISYAGSNGQSVDLSGLKVLCYALYLITLKERYQADYNEQSRQRLDAYIRAIDSLGLADSDKIKGSQLIFRQINFFVDDLWVFPRLVSFWKRRSGHKVPIAENTKLSAGGDLHAIFWCWYRRWEGQAVPPFLGGLRPKVKRSEQFTEFCKWVDELCHPPRRGRKPNVPRPDGLENAGQFISDFMAKNPSAERRDVIRLVIGLGNIEPMFHVVNRLSQPDVSPPEKCEFIALLEKSLEKTVPLSDEEETRLSHLMAVSERADPRNVILSGEGGERDKGPLVAGDKAMRLIERHMDHMRKAT